VGRAGRARYTPCTKDYGKAARPITKASKGEKSLLADREAVIAAAREIMAAQKYCAIITTDSDGRPQIRTMNPFPPEDDLTVWFATNSRCRKVREIRGNPQVNLYYADHQNAAGYVAIAGKAFLIDDPAEKLKRKRDYWEKAFPDWTYLVLIKVVPERLEVLNYQHNLLNDPVTWRTPVIEWEGPDAA
jgi:general stress protein 26